MVADPGPSRVRVAEKLKEPGRWPLDMHVTADPTVPRLKNDDELFDRM